MTNNNLYLYRILQKYKPRDLNSFSHNLLELKILIIKWASKCYLDILDSGSRAKGTAIWLASDVDYMISLSNDCNNNSGGLSSCYNSLYNLLVNKYGIYNVRKQNVSIRVKINNLEVDITPAKQQLGTTHFHSLYVSKSGSWTQTNIQRHILDISKSSRINEIKILKIWRELNKLDFPSIYLEYLLVNNILLNKSKDINSLDSNVWFIFSELAKTQNNPLYAKIVDPSNTNNILSDLLNNTEKNKIITQAQYTLKAKDWNQIVW